MIRTVLAVSLLVLTGAAETPAQDINRYRTAGNPECIYDAKSEGEAALRPRFSPDGRLISFTTVHNRGIRLLDPETGLLRQISDADGAGYGYKWSADGSAILARVSRFQGYYRYGALQIIDTATGEVTRISSFHTGITGLPQWTDGERTASVMERRGWMSYSTGRKPGPLAKPADAPVYFVKDGSIAVYQSAGGEVEMVVKDSDERIINLAVSPDRQRLAFEVLGGNLFVLDTNSGSRVDLGRGHRPQWAPDSRHITFMRTEDDGHRYLSSDIYIIGADGRGEFAVTSTSDRLEMNPDWSPDGGWIVFDEHNDGSLYRIRITE